MNITILGCGTSTGVPAVACTCSVCLSTDEKNKRTRSSIIVKKNNTKILIDTATDLRFQLIRENINSIDAVLYTHDHADHLHGLDDLRPLCRNNEMPVYGQGNVLCEIKKRFSYIFMETQKGGGKPKLELIPINRDPFYISDIRIEPIPVYHGKLNILGYRIENFAYITDCSFIPPESEEKLQNLDLIILGALRQRPHSTHFSIPQALDIIKKIRPRRALFTHLNHDVDYNVESANLPESVHLCYDGLKVKIKD